MGKKSKKIILTKDELEAFEETEEKINKYGRVMTEASKFILEFRRHKSHMFDEMRKKYKLPDKDFTIDRKTGEVRLIKEED